MAGDMRALRAFINASGQRRTWRASLLTGKTPNRRSNATASTTSKYQRPGPEDLSRWRAIIGQQGQLLSRGDGDGDGEAMKRFTQDWTRKWSSDTCPAIIMPETTEQVAQILRHCHDRGIAVVPQGGNTGLVGGSVPVGEEVVLSLSRMKKVLHFDEVSGVLVCEAGCILEELDNWLRAKGYIMPLDLGAKGSCEVGGNVSTNAGGLRFVRYGSLHGLVLGLEVVLADGTVLDLLSTLRKDNTGYDLKQLFIGAEGTLGVVTKVSIQVPPVSKSVNVAFLACKDFDTVKKVVRRSREMLGEIISAIEFVDSHSLHQVVTNGPGIRSPLQGSYPCYILIETSGSNEAHDSEKMAGFLETAMEEGLVEDGTLAVSRKQAREIWQLRELVPVVLEEVGRVFKYDVSLPMGVFYDIVEDMRGRLKAYPDIHVVGYGHLGDSNLHLNICVPRGSSPPPELDPEYIINWVASKKGSISAEHGLGQLKNKYMSRTKPPAVVDTMRKLKQLFDPKGILNPYKFLPPPSSSSE